MQKLISSHAKINLVLKVGNRRPENFEFSGYHEIHSLIWPLQYADEMVIEKLDSSSPFNLTVDFSAAIKEQAALLGNEVEKNLLYKTYSLYQQALPDQKLPNLSIHLKKNIPLQSGLGGGSSNAATLLNYLQHQASHPLNNTQLYQLASQIGADVPFFIKAQPAWVNGIGEVVKPLKIETTPHWEVLLVRPRNIHASTQKMFSYLERPIAPPEQNTWQPIDTHWENLNEASLQLYNDFLPYYLQNFDEVNTLYQSLKDMGIQLNLSGSGSCFFILCPNATDLLNLLIDNNVLSPSNYWLQATNPQL